MKTFGLIVPSGKGRTFERNVRSLLDDQPKLSIIILPILDAWSTARIQAVRLETQIVAQARRNEACQLLMFIPGVGAITASSFMKLPHQSRRLEGVSVSGGLRR
jgi:transposase